MTYQQAKDLLVSAMQEQAYAADTQKKFKASLTYICSFHNKYECVEAISPNEVQSFLNHLAFEKDLSPSTVNNYQAALKFLFEYVLHKTWPGEFSYFKIPRDKIPPQSLKAKSSHLNATQILPFDDLIPTFIKQMELRGNATGTQAAYLRAIRKFTSFTKKEGNMNKISLEDVKDFLHHERYITKLNPQTINTYRTAIKLFYITILNKEWHDLKIPSYKLEKRIPTILASQEVITLLKAIENPMYKMIGILMYSAGLRISEAIKIKISDIDSENMQILVTETKCHKDRYALLSQHCLIALRAYYKAYRPTNYLFPGQRYNLYISKESVQAAIRVAALKAKITKPVSPHTLRHCFATHLLENDTNLYHIKELLGHGSLHSTTRYLHTISFANLNVKSPLDLIGGLK